MKRLTVRRFVILALLILITIGLWHIGLLDVAQWSLAAGRLREFSCGLFPPQLNSLPTLAGAMIETVEIAFLGTMLGFFAALPIAFLASTIFSGTAVAYAVRLMIGAVRTVPSILWGIIFVVAFGLGPAAGTIGVAFYTLGYLGKLYYEVFEGVDAEVLEAVRGVGCSRLQLMLYAVLPESANAILSQLLFMFEYNIRASAIMGFVGAGGIGYYLLGYVQMLQYRNLLTALLLTFVVVMAVDCLSRKLRTAILPANPITS
ncbi:MAG: phosphonate ABC transporter, permease protein PhnE [Candidatus Omnitrophica bacterium]|nr:phosphonate ABC transporter, permease protein PhnE [Candidatus Omnitrophota bacterium]